MGPQLEDKALRKSTQWSSQPGSHQHLLGQPGVGDVGQRVQDGREAVQGDDHHDEAREIEPDDSKEDHDPAGDIISHPGHRDVPANLQGHLQQDHLLYL